jgi:hypothetical protein
MKTQTLIATVLILTGCASAPTWRHATKSAQEFYQDNSRCMAMSGSGQANQVVDAKDPFTQGFNQGLAMRAQGNQKLIHEQCMYGNGWYLSSKSGGPTLEIVRPADYESVKSWPQVGVSTTAQLGEQMIKTYTVAAMPAVRLTSAVRHIANYSDSLRMALDIDPTTLELAALDQQKGSYFPAPKGIRLAYEKKGAFPDPETLTGGLYLSADGTWSVYWYWPDYTTPTFRSGPQLQFKVESVERPPKAAGFQRELIYSGVAQSTISLLYREYLNDMVRPAYIQDLKYDSTKGSVVGFKGARVEILGADNTSVTYRVITPLQQ